MMRVFHIHAKPQDRNFEDAIFVPEKFSWPAFFFTAFWALWKRMWIVAALVIAVSLLAGVVSPVLGIVMPIGISLVMGFSGNEFYRWSLGRRGYVDMGSIPANSLEEAEIRFYWDRPVAAPEPVPVPQHVPPSAVIDPLGLFGSRS
jgi:Protein of unknown function (DUF2628)